MAFTINTVKKSVTGDLRMHILSCTADAATQNIETGLDRVYAAQMTPISMATAQSHSFYKNSLSAGTAAAGFVSITGVASGDEFEVVCWGT